MESFPWIQVALSFVLAGGLIAAATLLAEKAGSKIGGLITNLPSNILISFIFLANGNGIEYVREASISVPIGMAVDTLFLFVFIITLRYRTSLSAFFALLTWLVFAILTTQYLILNNALANILLYVATAIITFLICEKILKIKSVQKNKKNYSVLQIILRAVFAGSVVASVVLISNYMNAYFVGIVATFPAVLLTTILILIQNQGKQFARAAGKILLLSSTNIVVYSSMVYWTYPVVGITLGTLISFIASVLYVTSLTPLLRKIS